MSKLNKIFLVLLFASTILPLLPNAALAADWNEEGYVCPAGYVSIDGGKNSLGEDILKTETSGQAQGDINEFPYICANKNIVNGFAIDGAGDNDIHYCPTTSGAVWGIWGNGGKQGKWVGEVTLDLASYGKCCPTGFDYYYNEFINAQEVCCEDIGIPQEQITAATLSDACNGKEGKLPLYLGSVLSSPIQINNVDNKGNVTEPFRVGAESYVCNNGCVTAADGLFIPNPPLITEGNVSNYLCFGSGEAVPDNPGNDPATNAICFQGELYDEDDPIAQGGDIAKCQALEDTGEVEACVACLSRNDADPNNIKNFVYTSIGCVDTSRDGVITRVFQIGIGVIGGFAIIQVIRAGYIMQRRDPSSVQEAREMIMSVIYAIFMLVGAIVILRFVGVNILGLLPGGFFN